MLREIVVVQEQEAMRNLMGAVDESGRGARNAIGRFISSCLDLDKYSVILQSSFRLWSVRWIGGGDGGRKGGRSVQDAIR